ncbi:unnamed protein product [Paramecium sonneborni]|uniref:Transmembrane protein n=1 Tax=Paramecium sonneborni TaxID=65129 RepID=A0A8S1QRV4_9CILI|nr:unnamed protein product [Paramecium sonneborni]
MEKQHKETIDQMNKQMHILKKDLGKSTESYRQLIKQNEHLKESVEHLPKAIMHTEGEVNGRIKDKNFVIQIIDQRRQITVVNILHQVLIYNLKIQLDIQLHLNLNLNIINQSNSIIKYNIAILKNKIYLLNIITSQNNMLNLLLKDLKLYKLANIYQKEALLIIISKEVLLMLSLTFVMHNYINLHKEIKVKEIVLKLQILILKIILILIIKLLHKKLYQKLRKLMKPFKDYLNLNDFIIYAFQFYNTLIFKSFHLYFFKSLKLFHLLIYLYNHFLYYSLLFYNLSLIFTTKNKTIQFYQSYFIQLFQYLLKIFHLMFSFLIFIFQQQYLNEIILINFFFFQQNFNISI